MHYLDQQGNYYTGEQAPGGISVNAKPSANYKLKADWKQSLPDVWEFDSQTLKQALIQKAKDDYDAEHQELIFKHYPKYEPFSWNDQREEAKEWVAMTVLPTEGTPEPMQIGKNQAIVTLSCSWLFNACYPDGGEIEISVIDTFANKILENATQYKLAASTLLGRKRKRLAEINAAQSEEALLALQ